MDGLIVAVPVQALMSIKASLKDPCGVLDSWDKDSVDPCSWPLVTCSPENLVISLYVLLFFFFLLLFFFPHVLINF